MARHHIAPGKSGRAILPSKRSAQFIENFQRKKCDLAFVIIFKIKIPVAANSATRHAFDRRNVDHRKLIWLTAVVADKVMAR